MGGQPGPAMDASGMVDASKSGNTLSSQSITPSKNVQGQGSWLSGGEAKKSTVRSGIPDSFQVVFVKENVSVHPTEFASERVSGRLRLIKQGTTVILTWIPYAIEVVGEHGSSVVKSAEKVLLSEMRSIRRHTPPAGLQHIIIVLTSGLSLPPLYFHFSGVEEFLLTLGNHASLVRSRDDSSVYFVNNVRDAFQESYVTSAGSPIVPRKVEIIQQEKEKKRATPDESITNEVGATFELDGGAQGHFGINRSPASVLGRTRPNPLVLGEMSMSLENEGQVVNPNLLKLPDISIENHPLSSTNETEKAAPPPRKRYRRTVLDVPPLPPPSKPLLAFTPSLTQSRDVRNRHPRKTIDLVLNPDTAASTHVDPYPASTHSRKTVDLVLGSDVTASTHIELQWSHPRLRKTVDLELSLGSAAFTDADVSAVTPHSTGPSLTLVHWNRPATRKTVDLVISPVDITPVFQHDLVLSPADNSLVISHNKPVHPCVAPEPYSSSALSRTVEGVVHSSPANDQDVSLSQSPLSRGLHNDEAYFKFYGLRCSGSLRECVALPLNWRCRLHLTDLSSYRGALARRRWEWWSGISLSIAMVTGISIHVICSLLTSDLLVHLMIDARLTYKALNAIKYIDKLEFFQHVTGGDICNYLKTFFSKTIQNRQEWQRIDGSTSGASVENALPLATSMIPPYEQQPSALQQYAVYNVQPLTCFMTMLYEPRSSVSQQNGSPRLSNISKQNVKRGRSDILQQNIYLGRFLASQQNSNWRKLDVSQSEANPAKFDVLQQNANHGWVEYPSQENVLKGRGVRRWVQRSARDALRLVFEEWGCREITPNETVALAARFNGNPDAMQIQQLFRNWAQQKRRRDRAQNSSHSPTRLAPEDGAVRRTREVTEAASQVRSNTHSLGPVFGVSSQHPESKPTVMKMMPPEPLALEPSGHELGRMRGSIKARGLSAAREVSP